MVITRTARSLRS